MTISSNANGLDALQLWQRRGNFLRSVQQSVHAVGFDPAPGLRGFDVL